MLVATLYLAFRCMCQCVSDRRVTDIYLPLLSCYQFLNITETNTNTHRPHSLRQDCPQARTTKITNAGPKKQCTSKEDTACGVIVVRFKNTSHTVFEGTVCLCGLKTSHRYETACQYMYIHTAIVIKECNCHALPKV